ncbi:MAG: hypothetical protein AAFV85_13900 [Cyanobacteria bacterium J06634_6]
MPITVEDKFVRPQLMSGLQQHLFLLGVTNAAWFLVKVYGGHTLNPHHLYVRDILG